MDLLDLLSADHRDLQNAFDEYTRLASGALHSKEIVAAKICALLTRHERLEEEVLFPELETSTETADAVREMRREKDELELLVKAVRESTPGDPVFDAKIRALQETFVEHIAEEEEELFPAALELLGEETLEELAERAEEIRAELDTPLDEPEIPPLGRI